MWFHYPFFHSWFHQQRCNVNSVFSFIICLNWREHVVFISEHSTNKQSHRKCYKQRLKSKQLLTLLAPNRCTAFNVSLIHFTICYSSECNTFQTLCGYRLLLAILETIISHTSIIGLLHLEVKQMTHNSLVCKLTSCQWGITINYILLKTWIMLNFHVVLYKTFVFNFKRLMDKDNWSWNSMTI